jgi:hypothetical protein
MRNFGIYNKKDLRCLQERTTSKNGTGQLTCDKTDGIVVSE